MLYVAKVCQVCLLVDFLCVVLGFDVTVMLIVLV